MYWICLTKEELELAIRALEQFYTGGVSTDEEQKDDEAMRELVKKLEFFKEHDR